VPAQHARAPLAKDRPVEVQLGRAVPVAPRPAAAHLALEHHHQVGIEAQHPVEALSAVGLGYLLGEVERLCVRREEHTHQPSPPHLATRGAFLGRVDDVRRLHVHDAVREAALRGLADRLQKRLARERDEPQHDHRGARQLVLVPARQIAIGLEQVQVGVGGRALHRLAL
jgi:hypothetical protein